MLFIPGCPAGKMFALSDEWVFSDSGCKVVGDGEASILGSINAASKAVMRVTGDNNTFQDFSIIGRSGGLHGLIVGDESGTTAADHNKFMNLFGQFTDGNIFHVERGQSNRWIGCTVNMNNGYEIVDYSALGYTRGAPDICFNVNGHSARS